MMKIIPSSGLLLLLLACSDAPQAPTEATSGPRATAAVGAEPTAIPFDFTQCSGGSASDVRCQALTAAKVGTPPQILIAGNARGCFGDGCTPTGLTTAIVNGVPITYFSFFLAGSVLPPDFSGITAGGLLAINSSGTSITGDFGAISVVGSAGGATPVSTSFTLLLTFVSPVAPNVSVSATLNGTVWVLGTGGVVLSFDKKSSAGGRTISKIPFSDATTGAQGQLSLTLFPVAIPSGGSGLITGLFQVE